MMVYVVALLFLAIAKIEKTWAVDQDHGSGFNVCMDEDDCAWHEDCMYGACEQRSDCFSGNNVVTTKTGEKLIKDLHNNEHVLTIDSDGAMRYQPVMLDIHRNPALMSEFVRVATEDGKEITLTAKHYLYVTDGTAGVSSSRLVAADQVRPGSDSLLTQQPDGTLSRSKVAAVHPGIRERGVYNPLVASGRLMVGGVLASVYADDIPPISPTLAHTLLWPIRQMWAAAVPLGGYVHPVSGMPYWAHAANLIRASVI